MYKEIEYKYDAKSVNLQRFSNLMEALRYSKCISVSSYDNFFTKEQSGDEFIRYRYNDTTQELTLKKKTCDFNNNNRIEINLDIKELDTKKIKTFLEMIGYSYRFQIYKTCFIYIFDKAIISYYIVYDENMKELGRFIEIEADEKYDWKDESEAFEKINEFEKLLYSLNITLKDRLTQSLFEMYFKTFSKELAYK
jgi:adenylate cyclase class IV